MEGKRYLTKVRMRQIERNEKEPRRLIRESEYEVMTRKIAIADKLSDFFRDYGEEEE